MIITFFMFSLQEGAVGHSFRQFFFMISYVGTRNLKGKPFLIKLKPSYVSVLFSFIFDINIKITVLLKLKHIENIKYHYYKKKANSSNSKMFYMKIWAIFKNKWITFVGMPSS